jgi:hypothetical protein
MALRLAQTLRPGDQKDRFDGRAISAAGLPSITDCNLILPAGLKRRLLSGY